MGAIEQPATICSRWGVKRRRVNESRRLEDRTRRSGGRSRAHQQTRLPRHRRHMPALGAERGAIHAGQMRERSRRQRRSAAMPNADDAVHLRRGLQFAPRRECQAINGILMEHFGGQRLPVRHRFPVESMQLRLRGELTRQNHLQSHHAHAAARQFAEQFVIAETRAGVDFGGDGSRTEIARRIAGDFEMRCCRHLERRQSLRG
jgi:hypothetical protein